MPVFISAVNFHCFILHNAGALMRKLPESLSCAAERRGQFTSTVHLTGHLLGWRVQTICPQKGAVCILTFLWQQGWEMFQFLVTTSYVKSNKPMLVLDRTTVSIIQYLIGNYIAQGLKGLVRAFSFFLFFSKRKFSQSHVPVLHQADSFGLIYPRLDESLSEISVKYDRGEWNLVYGNSHLNKSKLGSE